MAEPRPTPTVSALLMRPIVAALADGPPGALDALYAATGLTAELIADPDARIAPEALRRAWKELARLTGDPQIALRASATTPPGAFGIVEYLARSSATVEQAMRLGLRYLAVLDEVGQVELIDDVAAGLAYVRVIVDSPIPAEASFAFVVSLGRKLIGGAAVHAVDFTHRPDGDLAAYERYFGAPVRFGARWTQLVVSRAVLTAPLATADPNLLPILIRHADELAARVPANPPVTEQVRRVLCELMRTGAADIEQVAARLGLAARSLQRRLKGEGRAFHEVRDALRRELATRYLDSGLSTAEVSFLLGFSEASGFFRAYKRWTGQSPRGHSSVASGQ